MVSAITKQTLYRVTHAVMLRVERRREHLFHIVSKKL